MCDECGAHPAGDALARIEAGANVLRAAPNATKSAQWSRHSSDKRRLAAVVASGRLKYTNNQRCDPTCKHIRNAAEDERRRHLCNIDEPSDGADRGDSPSDVRREQSKALPAVHQNRHRAI